MAYALNATIPFTTIQYHLKDVSRSIHCAEHGITWDIASVAIKGTTYLAILA